MDETKVCHDGGYSGFFMSDSILKITMIFSRLAKYLIMQVHVEKRKSWQPVATKENEPGVC